MENSNRIMKSGRQRERERERERSVPNVEEIRSVAHLEVEVNGIDERAVSADVEAVDPRVREPWPRRQRQRRLRR